MPLHPGQIKYIEDTFKLQTKINVLNPSNRYGKTTVAACLHLHAHFYKLGVPTGNRKAWVKAQYRTANVAPKSSLVEPVFNYIDQIMSSSFPIQLPDGRIVSNKCQIEWFYLKEMTRESPVHKQFFAFNSYIEHRTLGATAADSLEGKPFGLITYDEGGRSMHLEEEVSGTILARLFDWSGQFHLISTPDQTSPSIQYHHKLFEAGKLQDYANTQTYSMEGALRDNIFFPPEQIEKQYELYKNNPLGPQVLEGKFVFGGATIFNYASITEAEDIELNHGLRREDNHQYVIGIDTAMGSDEMVYSVLDITKKPFKLVKYIAAKGNSKSQQVHLHDLCDLFDVYKNETTEVNVMLETWNGESANFYQNLPYYIQLVTQCYGSWQPNRSNLKNAPRPRSASIKKADVLLALEKLLSARELKIPANNIELSRQLATYQEKDDNLDTDRVFSLAMAAWLASEQTLRAKEIVLIDL